MATPLGCKRDAQAAVNGGLRLIGAGAFRQVFVDERERFVYKVVRYGEWHVNETEADTSERAREEGLPGIPRTWLWWVWSDSEGKEVPVLAMRYYPRLGRNEAGMTPPEKWMKVMREWFGDMHPGNWALTPGGHPRLLDMQFFDGAYG